MPSDFVVVDTAALDRILGAVNCGEPADIQTVFSEPVIEATDECVRSGLFGLYKALMNMPTRSQIQSQTDHVGGENRETPAQ